MPTPIVRAAPPLLLITAAAGLAALVPANPQRIWQADVRVRTLEVTRSRTAMSIRVVVYTEHDDEARDARLLVLLPVGVSVEHLGTGCTASAGPPGVPSLRATVSCELGAIVDRGFREVLLSTTLPPDATPRRLGVFAYSATPDPIPGNNYAERIIP